MNSHIFGRLKKTHKPLGSKSFLDWAVKSCKTMFPSCFQKGHENVPGYTWWAQQGDKNKWERSRYDPAGGYHFDPDHIGRPGFLVNPSDLGLNNDWDGPVPISASQMQRIRDQAAKKRTTAAVVAGLAGTVLGVMFAQNNLFHYDDGLKVAQGQVEDALGNNGDDAAKRSSSGPAAEKK